MTAAELRAQLEELQRKQAEILAMLPAIEQAEKIEAETPTTLTVEKVTERFVYVKLNKYDANIVQTLRNLPTRIYDHSTNLNRFEILKWPSAAEELAKHFNLVYSDEQKSEVEKILLAPSYFIYTNEKKLFAKWAPNISDWALEPVPGYMHTGTEREAAFPLTEGWRLHARTTQLFDNRSKDDKRTYEQFVNWDPKALRIVTSELERRAKLNNIATLTDVELDIPFLAPNKARPFQKVGVHFFEEANGIALNADQMGLGKTWQAVGYAIKNDYRTLIVCPAHLIANWTKEIRKLTGKDAVQLSGRVPDEYALNIANDRSYQFFIINYDIVSWTTDITTDDDKVNGKDKKVMYLWPTLFNACGFDLVVLDECHYIKNTSSNRSRACRLLKTPRRIGLTGTPLLNRPKEFWPTLNWLHPDMFPSETTFEHQFSDGRNGAKNVSELRSLLQPIMIRRLTKDVVNDLPPINRIVEYHALSGEGAEKYKKVLEGVYEVITKAGDHFEREVPNILVELNKLKEVCARDKTEHSADLAVSLYDSTEEDAKNRKVLIFSQFVSCVHDIAARLGNEAISWTGETDMKERTRLEGEFQNNPDVKFLVVSLMTAQTGLNLTAAGSIIFNDLWWTPAAHAQAEQRAYGRLLDMHGAESYYVVCQNTYEEDIQSMLASKLATINEVIEGMERDNSIALNIISAIRDSMKKMRNL